jgi:hypothetical protein
MHVDGLGVDRIKGYRYPAPGSQVKPRVPVRESEDELYDVTHFAKDSRNVPFAVSGISPSLSLLSSSS